MTTRNWAFVAFQGIISTIKTDFEDFSKQLGVLRTRLTPA